MCKKTQLKNVKTENVNLGLFIFKDSTGRWNIEKCTPDAKGKTLNNNNDYYC